MPAPTATATPSTARSHAVSSRLSERSGSSTAASESSTDLRRNRPVLVVTGAPPGVGVSSVH
ncbi:Uncharacterised protein [Mycobacteroides abscessus]|nr:Uncharacterised protein [Mycobacteroides abscessus]